MAKLISISLLDEEIDVERLLEALNKLSSRDLRKYFKRKKMLFPRSLRYTFLAKCIKKDFQAIQKEQLNSDNRVFTEFELVEFYKCVDNEVLAQGFKKEFLANFVKSTYKNYLTDKNLADLYTIAVNKEEPAVESIYGFLVGLNPIFTDNEENNLDCLPVEQTAQRIKDQFTLYEVREFAKKYNVIVPKYPNANDIAPAIVEKAETKGLLDQAGLDALKVAEANVLLSFAKKHGFYVPRYLKKDEVIDEVISQIASKEIDNSRMNDVFNANLITFKSRSSSDSLCDLLDKYENLDDLSEVRNDNHKDMSPLKRCSVGGAIGLELRYNEETRKARLLERRKKLELLRQQALERKERFNRDRREQELIAQRDESERLKLEEEARRIAAEARIAELEALLLLQNSETNTNDNEVEETPKVEEVVITPETLDEEELEDQDTEFGEDEIVTPEYYETVIQEPVEVEEEKEVTYMDFETVEEENEVEETLENDTPEVVIVDTPEEEPVEVEEVIEEELQPEEEAQEPEEEEAVVVEEVIEEVVEEPKEEEKTSEVVEEEKPAEEEPKVEPVKCPVKKLHIIGGIISAVFVALMAFLLLQDGSVINNAWDKLVSKTATPDAASYAVAFVLLFVGYGIVAYIARVIIHAIRCKAKKGVACKTVTEVYKYLWARVIVAVIAVFAFIQADIFHFGSRVKEKFGNLISKVLDNSADVGPLANILLLVVLFAVSYLLTLVVCNIVYAIKAKKTPNNGGVIKNLISFCWTLTVVMVLVAVALVVVKPNVATGIYNDIVENVKGALNLTFKPLVVNAAASAPSNSVSLDSVTNLVYTFIAGFVAVYLLGLTALTVGYKSHINKLKAKEEAARLAEQEVVEEEQETPVEETPAEEVVEEEQEEKLLFTTFEEAKLIEDLNDLNRMIGKVNEHVKDLSAIQARLYNELVGEDEIVVDPIEEKAVVIPEEPKVEENLETKEENKEEPQEEVQETPKSKKEKKVKEPKVKKEKPKKEPKIKKPYCGVHTRQKLVAILLVVITLVLIFGMKELNVLNTIKELYAADKTVYTPIELGKFLLILVYAAFIFTVLFRTVTHSLRCRARSALYCSDAHEIKSTCLMTLIIVILCLLVFSFTDIHSILNGLLNYIKEFFNGVSKGDLGDTKDPNNIFMYIGLGIIGLIALVIVIALIVGFFKFIALLKYIFGKKEVVHTHKKEKKNKKKSLKEVVDNITPSSNDDVNKLFDGGPMQSGVMYFPCMMDGKIQMMPVTTAPMQAAVAPAPTMSQPMGQMPMMQQPQLFQPVQAYGQNPYMPPMDPYGTNPYGMNPYMAQVDPASYSQTLQPLQIVQPIQLIQPVSSVAVNDEFYRTSSQTPDGNSPVEEFNNNSTQSVEAAKVKDPVRKSQKAWFVITLLLAAVLVAAYMFVGAFKSSFTNVSNAEQISKLADTDLFVVAGSFILVVLILSQWIRFLLHPISCKINKTKVCCKTCEKYSYLWTVVIVGVALVVLFITKGVLNFDLIWAKVSYVVTCLISGKIFLTPTCIALYAGLVLFALFLLVLVFKSLAHKAKHKKTNK